MENASKALLIAGGVLISIIILSLIVIAYTNISNYYNEDRALTRIEQITKFNNEYTGYVRDDVKGSELLSLVNKIVDYNDRKADPEDIAYEHMRLTIKIGDTSEFLFDLSDLFYPEFAFFN